jgi:hypothetical protein
MTSETPSTETPDEQAADRFRQWVVAHSPFPVTLRGKGALLTVAYGLLFAGNIIGIAAAQAGGGGGAGAICGTAIATTVNEVVPLALTVTIFGGLILSYLLHSYAGFKKDPNKVTQIKNWRNRAGLTALSAPLFGKLLEIVIGFIGLGLAGCIEIVPGI